MDVWKYEIISRVEQDISPVAKLSIATDHALQSLQLSRTIKTIVNLHGITCCYA